MGKNELVNLLDTFCYEEIFNYIKNHVDENLDDVYIIKLLDYKPYEVEVADIEFINSVNTQINGNIILSDVIIVSSVDYRDTYREDTKECEQWFLMSIELQINDSVENFKINNLETYSKKRYEKSGNSVSNNFVPILSNADLEKEAENLLKKYYPMALCEPMVVPVKDIAKIMGLRISDKYHFDTSVPIFGAISFFDCTGKLLDKDNNKIKMKIPKGSIIIDSNTYYLGNVGCVNYTIAHELYHWHKHKIYAEVKRLLEGNESSKILFRCKTNTKTGAMFVNQRDDIDWMEWQANKIAPKILMPKLMFKRKMIEYFNDYGYFDASKDEKNDIVNLAIEELSLYFKVSKQAVMIRMLDFNIEEVEQIYDKRYIKTDIYEIEPTSYYLEYRQNKIFKDLVDSGKFIYVNNHMVINDCKYVIEDKIGRQELTEYAKDNKDECCLKFDERLILNKKKLKALSSLFFRGQDQEYCKCVELANNMINSDAITTSIDSQKCHFENAMKFEQRLLDSIVSDFGKSVENIINIFAEELNFDKRTIISEIEERTHINKKTISDMKLNSKASKKMIIAFGVGLKLGYIVTQKLLQVAGHSLQVNGDDYMYVFALNVFRGKSIDEINTYLANLGYEELGSK